VKSHGRLHCEGVAVPKQVFWHSILPVRLSYQGLLRMRTSIIRHFCHAKDGTGNGGKLVLGLILTGHSLPCHCSPLESYKDINTKILLFMVLFFYRWMTALAVMWSPQGPHPIPW